MQIPVGNPFEPATQCLKKQHTTSWRLPLLRPTPSQPLHCCLPGASTIQAPTTYPLAVAVPPPDVCAGKRQ